MKHEYKFCNKSAIINGLRLIGKQKKPTRANQIGGGKTEI